ncbi:hypothetical protein ACP70R_037325 [Stipagrostis hirtigluma subsp. patula]
MLPQPVLEYWNLVINIGFTDNGGWTGSDLARASWTKLTYQ